MKKYIALFCCAFVSLSAFAAYGGDLSGVTLFLLVVYIILSIVILVRWWKMTEDVKLLREHVTAANPKLTYLVAVGEKEQASKAALRMMVDLLYPIYLDNLCNIKAVTMNRAIAERLPKIEKLGIELPDYVKSGEKFIDYINSLTGREVSYGASDSGYYSLQ